MSEKLKVSLIVAIYKSEKFLDKLITSIINQTYKNLEIILVDDGSPDNSGIICDKYAKQDDRIKVIHKENGGTCDARNKGIEAVTGEYFFIIDGDDWLEPDFVDYLLGIALKTESEFAFSDKIFTTMDREQTKEDKIEIWTPEEATAAIIYPHMEIGPWNKIYKTSMIKENNISFSVPWSGEGLYFAVMAAQHSTRVGVGHRKVYNYRLNNEGSGLTNYNVQLGFNALDNIKFIGESLVNKTPRLEKAVNWHIWKNNYFLLSLIIATDNVNKYKKEYYNCIHYIRKKLPAVLIQSEVSIYEKCRMIYIAMNPVRYAKKSIERRRISLANDNYE